MRTVTALIILIASAFGLAACSSQESVIVKPAEVEQQPAASVQQPTAVEPKQQPAVVVPKHQPQVSPLRRKVVLLLEKKQYRQAIELLNGRYHEGLEREFVLALNGLLEVGDDAFSLGDYAPAAYAFKGVLTAYPLEPSLRVRISHDPKRIRYYLETCTNRMMEQGLEEYRRGKLESAIRKWKELLTINPGHHEAKKALNTATVQLQALQNMKKK